mgnify:CR=1 FL=1
MHLHILGICGTFMGGIAAIARQAGHRVTGCDANVYPPMSTQLEAQGIELIEGFSPEQISLKPDLFIIGNVVSRGNPLMEKIHNKKKRMPVILPEDQAEQWIKEDLSVEEIAALARFQFPADQLEYHTIRKDFRQLEEPREAFLYDELPAIL